MGQGRQIANLLLLCSTERPSLRESNPFLTRQKSRQEWVVAWARRAREGERSRRKKNRNGLLATDKSEKKVDGRGAVDEDAQLYIKTTASISYLSSCLPSSEWGAGTRSIKKKLRVCDKRALWSRRPWVERRTSYSLTASADKVDLRLL